MKSLQFVFVIASALSIAHAEELLLGDRIYGRSTSDRAARSSPNSLQARFSIFILTDLSNAIGNYELEYNCLPKGDNRTLVAVLAGAESNEQNFRQIKFLDLVGVPNQAFNLKDNPAVFLNPEGELLDGWGRPLVICSQSDGFAVLSAGANGILNQAAEESDSSDDIYVKVSLAKEATPSAAEQAGAGQPATKPADKVPANAKPPTSTSKESPR